MRCSSQAASTLIGAAHVGVVVFLDRSPRADLARAVNDRIDTFGGFGDCIHMGDVAVALFYAGSRQRRIRRAIECAHGMALREQLRADCLAEKPTATRYQNFQSLISEPS